MAGDRSDPCHIVTTNNAAVHAASVVVIVGGYLTDPRSVLANVTGAGRSRGLSEDAIHAIGDDIGVGSS